MIKEAITIENEDYNKALQELAEQISKELVNNDLAKIPVNFSTIKQEITSKPNQKPKFRLSWMVNQG